MAPLFKIKAIKITTIFTVTQTTNSLPAQGKSLTQVLIADD